MQTGSTVKSVSAGQWGLAKTETPPGEPAEGLRQEGGLPPVHEPLRRRNALGDIFLGIDTEQVDRLRLDGQVTPAGGALPLATQPRTQDDPHKLSRKRRRHSSEFYTTLETIYEEDTTESESSSELLQDSARLSHNYEINNNTKRRVGLGNIFAGVDEASVEGLRRVFSCRDADDKRSQDENKEALLLDEDAKPPLRRRKAQANIFEGLDTASVESLQQQYGGKASSSPNQDTTPTTSPLKKRRLALWHVLEALGVSVQGIRHEHSHNTNADSDKTSAHLYQKQSKETKMAANSRKPVLQRRDASLNLLEGVNEATLQVLRGEGNTTADNSSPDAPAVVSDYVSFSQSPRATRRRNALTDITDLQKLYQTTCKSTGTWLSGMFAC
ncbi:PREDICTED: uncharacterized protein LOC109462901 [Branchiostoma belcheri]|uniref:Uncharacterized protein LOC109462901 n=1 Tax=Branchiostoma belcheri TaxID=7741 RepID=A0A6P4XF17_BRABE|nr:PREDICTED: uncharacterized protein LOC109462901 [Branchiostoma belcheri]